MPSVKQAIRERYSVSNIFPYIEYKNKITLSFAPDFPADKKNKILELLGEMNIRQNYPAVSTIPTVDIMVSMLASGLIAYDCEKTGINGASLSGGRARLILCLNNFGDAVTDAAWLAYILTQNLIVLDPSGDRYLDINVFSMRQQKVATIIKGAVGVHRDPNKNISLAQSLWNLSKKYIGAYVSSAPRFSQRPVTDSGWAIISGTLKGINLFKKGERCEHGFDRKLYAGQFSEVLDDYIELLEDTSEDYRRDLREAGDFVIKNLKTHPFLTLKNDVKLAREQIAERCESECDRLDGLRFEGGSYVKLTPETMHELFAKQDAAYRQYVELKLIAAFVKSLCEAVLDDYDHCYSHINRTLTECYDDVNTITDLTAEVRDGIVPWNSFDNLPASLLNAGDMDIPDYTRRFIDLHKSFNDIVIDTWITRQHYDGSASTYVVNTLNEDILVSIGYAG